MNQEIFEQVRDIVAELLDIDPEMITPESKFQADLGADSLDLVELIMEFEEQLGGEISDEDAQKITTVGEAVDFMEDLMKSEEEEEVLEEVIAEVEPEEAEPAEEEPQEPEESEQDEEAAEETPVEAEAKEGEAEA